MSNDLFLTCANLNNVSNNGRVRDPAGGNININGYFPFRSASDIGGMVWTKSDTEDYGQGTMGSRLKKLKNPQALIGNIII